MEEIKGKIFELCYTAHGGSGLHGITRSDCLDMDLAELDDWYKRLKARREAEAKHIRAGRAK